MIKHLREANLLLANHRTDAAFHRHKPMNRDWQLVVVCQAHHSPADHECRISSMLAAAAGVTLIATLLGNLFVGPSMGAPLLAANQFACNPRSCGPDRGHRIHWSPLAPDHTERNIELIFTLIIMGIVLFVLFAIVGLPLWLFLVWWNDWSFPGWALWPCGALTVTIWLLFSLLNPQLGATVKISEFCYGAMQRDQHQ